MKVLQINTTIGTGSTGRITEEIGQTLQEYAHQSFIAYREAGSTGSSSNLIRVGNDFDFYLHGIRTRLWDRHGLGSKRATQSLVKEIEQVNPDLINIHNLHGYYLNIEVLFNFFREVQIPVVWTLHDCWPLTGHCSFFDYVNCDKWKTECFDCPLSDKYPASWFLDQSKKNFYKKKEIFNGLNNLTIVTPSQWLKRVVNQSFLSDYPVTVIHNGIDTKQFRPVSTDRVKSKYGLLGHKVLLGVASVWDRRKGLKYFLELSKLIDDSFRIVLIGLPKEKITQVPYNVIGIPRTENMDELASFYSVADVFVNPTVVDNFPTTNLEALACGTPVVTFNTGGSPEAIDNATGITVEKGNITQLLKAVKAVSNKSQNYRRDCRKRAITYYTKEERYRDYINLYEKILYENQAIG